MRHSENNKKFTVKYCLKCNHAWENSNGKVLIHLDFPSYQLQRKTCAFCKKKETIEQKIRSIYEKISKL